MNLAALFAIFVIAFCAYLFSPVVAWFSPTVAASRAQVDLIKKGSQAVARAWDVAEQRGLYSDAATTALAEAERTMFVVNCVTVQFKHKTTIHEYRSIESGCKRKLLIADAEARRALGENFSGEQ